MAGISNNLYPPIVDTYTPAFIYNGTCKVYFDISSYNSKQDFHQNSLGIIDLIQVIVQDQKTNQSILNQNSYPSGIKLTTLKQNNKGYYIEIPASDIQGGFKLNEYYKVQIRFTSKDSAAAPNSSAIDGWLANNLNYFSEWSAVTLIRGISQPNISIKDINGASLNRTHLYVDGKVSFTEPLDNEKLKSYNLKLYNQTTGELLQSSGELESIDNKINYSIRKHLQNGINYQLALEITTTNFYTLDSPKLYNFSISNKLTPFSEIQVTAIKNNKKGCIEINILNKAYQEQQEETGPDEFQYIANNAMLIGSSLYFNYTEQSQDYKDGNNKIINAPYLRLDIEKDIAKSYDNDSGQLMLNKKDTNLLLGMYILIRRCSSRTNFQEWDTLGTIPIDSAKIKRAFWNDYTAEPGVWYKYAFIKCSSQGDYLSSYEMEEPVLLDCWDIFLSSKDKQLKIAFDPQITSFSTKMAESVVETIGSKYPFIRRNGKIKYKTFSLSGTITAFMDLGVNTFKSGKKNLYQDSENYYYIYNQQNGVTPYTDIIYEKFFREEVIKFLEQNSVKLFRSLTQGNMLVKLTDISFTPNITLGRMIYTFSCTAYEISDGSNMDNIKKYNIMKNEALRYERG